MGSIPPLFTHLRQRLQSFGAGLRRGWEVVHLGAVILVLALSPSSYRRAQWPQLAQHLYQATAPVLLWFTVLSSLLGLVLIRIVVVTAQSYGLSQYAVDMVVRVLVLELIPLATALFVALRITIPQSAELWSAQGEGQARISEAWDRAAWARWVLPRVLAGVFSVLMLVAVSCLVALVLAYLNIYGFTPWALTGYNRLVGQVFNPSVTLIFTFKTCFFALIVTLIPLASSLHNAPRPELRGRAELQTLVRMTLALLAIEAVSLMGNYY